MKSAVDVEDAAVQKMVEESVQHFFEDTRARQWVEGKLKAIDTAAATRHGLAECGAELEPANRERIERALAALESVLAAEDPATKTGDPKSLQQTTLALDEATHPLADLLMDRAMEAMLRKRGAIQ
jgi:molecular chaperone DnaK